MMRTLYVEPLLRFQSFDALLKWIPQRTEVYVVYDRYPEPCFRVYGAFDPATTTHPTVYEVWKDWWEPLRRIGGRDEAEDWLKSQRRLSAVRVVSKDRTIRYTPVYIEDITIIKEGEGW